MNKYEQNLKIFNGMLNFNLVVTNSWRKFGLYLVFEDFAYFGTAYGQIWPFHFFGPGNPE